MTQEEKDLLLKDLSARLTYGIKGIITYNGDKDIFTVKGIFNILFLSDTECCHVEDFKPYLRPLLSMTAEEKEELVKEFWGSHTIKDRFEEVCWYLSKHFDINGLIEKGLAIAVTEANNPYKNDI